MRVEVLQLSKRIFEGFELVNFVGKVAAAGTLVRCQDMTGQSHPTPSSCTYIYLSVDSEHDEIGLVCSEVSVGGAGTSWNLQLPPPSTLETLIRSKPQSENFSTWAFFIDPSSVSCPSL